MVVSVISSIDAKTVCFFSLPLGDPFIGLQEGLLSPLYPFVQPARRSSTIFIPLNAQIQDVLTKSSTNTHLCHRRQHDRCRARRSILQSTGSNTLSHVRCPASTVDPEIPPRAPKSKSQLQVSQISRHQSQTNTPFMPLSYS